MGALSITGRGVRSGKTVARYLARALGGEGGMFGRPGMSAGSEVDDTFRICNGGEAKASRCWCSSCSESRPIRVALFPDLYLCLSDQEER